MPGHHLARIYDRRALTVPQAGHRRGAVGPLAFLLAPLRVVDPIAGRAGCGPGPPGFEDQRPCYAAGLRAL
jgi:hypothetical protein